MIDVDGDHGNSDQQDDEDRFTKQFCYKQTYRKKYISF